MRSTLLMASNMKNKLNYGMFEKVLATLDKQQNPAPMGEHFTHMRH